MNKKIIIAVVVPFIFFSLLNSCSSSYREPSNINQSRNRNSAIFPDSVTNKFVTGFTVPSITPDGTFLRVIIVFVQFPDDNWKPDFSEWKKGKAPAYKDDIIDSTLSEKSGNENITEYFKEMSLGKFNVIGNTLNEITPHSREWYLANHKQRGFINKEVLRKIDSTFSFKKFDNWTYVKENMNNFQPDGKVDMIWMIYRNISMDLKNVAKTAAELGFGTASGRDRYDKWSGEASLGYGSNFYVDDSTRIVDMNFYGGSGITIMEGYSGYNKVRNLCIHEFGHHLLGGINMHTGGGFWGLMSGFGSRSPCANSFERNTLGWTNPIEIKKDTIVDVSLDDFVTTGQNIKILIPGKSAGEYYYLENHQCKVPFDIPVRNEDSKGLYLLHQTYPENSSIKLISAAGRWDWIVNNFTKNPWGSNILPVFKRTIPDPLHGYFETDMIPYKDEASRNSSFYAFIYINPYTGKQDIHPYCLGWGYDAFNKNYCNVFSEWSNPRALNQYNQPVNVAFQILSEDRGKIKLRIFVGKKNVKQIPPSKVLNLSMERDSSNHPLLQWQINIEPSLAGYNVYRSSDKENYNKISFVHFSHNGAENLNVENAGDERWIDTSVMYKAGSLKYSYKISAYDSLGRESVLSSKAIQFIHK